MEVSHIIGTWAMEPELKDGMHIECPECKKYNCHKDWNESSVYCELCGDHAALECPECYERFDHVRSPIFKTK